MPLSYRNVMLAVPMKGSHAVDVRGPLADWIKENYGVHMIPNCSDDLDAVAALREEAASATLATDARLSALRRWYRALSSLEVRFPMSNSEITVKFAWDDAFKPSQKQNSTSIHLEKSAVLFNIGAALFKLASECDRATGAGLGQAARYLQDAAGCFGYLRDHVALKLDAASRPEDISPEGCSLLEKTALAHAQQCCYESALIGSKSAVTLSRLAKQCAALYVEAEELARAGQLAKHLDKTWGLHLQAKAGSYEALAELHQAQVAREAGENGPEVARLRKAAELAGAAGRTARATGDSKLQDACNRIAQDVTAGLNRAEKENRAVYLCRVPSYGDLPVIAPALLVKPSPAGTALQTAEAGDEAPLFSSVVPEDMARSLSRFTDRVDRLVREQLERIDGMSEEVQVAMRMWELPEALAALDGPSEAAIPEAGSCLIARKAPPLAVRQEIASIREQGSMESLHGLADQIDDMKGICTDEIQKLEALLDKEQEDDDNLRSRLGRAWERTPSSSLSKAYRDRIAQLKGHMTAAASTDQEVRGAMSANENDIQRLSVQGATTRMPRLEAPIVQVADVAPAETASRLRSLLIRAEELAAERAELEAALKQDRDRCDVSQRLASGEVADEDALFAAEMARFDPTVRAVDANVSATKQLLKDIHTAQAEYRTAFEYDRWQAECREAVNQVLEVVSTCRTIMGNLEAGLRFYIQVQDELQNVGNVVKDFLVSRRTERDELLQDLQRRGRLTSPPPLSPSPGPPPPSHLLHHGAPPDPQGPPHPPVHLHHQGAPSDPGAGLPYLGQPDPSYSGAYQGVQQQGNAPHLAPGGSGQAPSGQPRYGY